MKDCAECLNKKLQAVQRKQVIMEWIMTVMVLAILMGLAYIPDLTHLALSVFPPIGIW